MISSVHFAGNRGRQVCISILIFFALVSSPNRSYALHQYFADSNYTYPALIYAGATTTFYFISQFEDGPFVFAGLYGISSMYLLREVYAHKNEMEDLVVPIALVTMAVLNAALFKDDENYKDHDVFLYNWLGATAIAAYGTWEHSQRSFHKKEIVGHTREEWTWAILPNAKNPGVNFLAQLHF